MVDHPIGPTTTEPMHQIEWSQTRILTLAAIRGMIDRPYENVLLPCDGLGQSLPSCHARASDRYIPSPSVGLFGRPKCQPKMVMSSVHITMITMDIRLCYAAFIPIELL